MNKPLKVFITYSHKNTESKNELITRLDAIKREGKIGIWHDNEILPGDKWRDAIFNNLADSNILLYLVSADSLASKNCNKELAAALYAELRVIPIILERCDWNNHQLSDFQALPKFAKPISEWKSESAGWQNVVEGIRKVVDKVQLQTASSSDISQDKLRAELAFQRGNFLVMVGQLDMATQAYSDSIELNSRYANAYNNRGRTYADKGDLDNAIRDFDKAIELDSNNAVAYNNRGGAYFIKDELDNALEDFTNAIAIKPDYVMAYDNRAKVWLLRQELEKAVVDLASARARAGV